MRLFRSVWSRYWLRRVKFTGRYGDLQRLYAVRDPWNLSGTLERERFEATNAIVRTVAPECGRLLELGCGEGLQTSWLTKVSDHVAGIDVSAMAVARARVLCPAADLRAGEAESIGRIFAGERFDIVTAFEVLYYSSAIDEVLAQARLLADCILVTNLAERAARMRSHFTGPGWVRLDDVRAGDLVWECDVWRRSADC